jgi:hypothetical protein
MMHMRDGADAMGVEEKAEKIASRGQQGLTKHCRICSATKYWQQLAG